MSKKSPKRTPLTKLEREVLPRLHVGAFEVSLKHRRSASDMGSGGTFYADASTHVHVNGNAVSGTRYDLPEQLRQLANFLSGTEDDFNGSAEIIVLRRHKQSVL